jgi:hypothetical protein
MIAKIAAVADESARAVDLPAPVFAVAERWVGVETLGRSGNVRIFSAPRRGSRYIASPYVPGKSDGPVTPGRVNTDERLTAWVPTKSTISPPISSPTCELDLAEFL